MAAGMMSYACHSNVGFRRLELIPLAMRMATAFENRSTSAGFRWSPLAIVTAGLNKLLLREAGLIPSRCSRERLIIEISYLVG